LENRVQQTNAAACILVCVFVNTPILKYSSTPKRFAPTPAKPLNSDPRKAGSWTDPKDRVFNDEYSFLILMNILEA
jgi:hypothetical protein